MAFQFPVHLTTNFSATLQEQPGRWVVVCTGTLDTADAATVVQPQLLRLHAAMVEAKVPLVSLDLRGVEYMNSSGLKSFMVWFLTASNTSDTGYTIEVGYNPELSWQLMSLKPMERLAPKTVRLLPGGQPTGAAAR